LLPSGEHVANSHGLVYVFWLYIWISVVATRRSQIHSEKQGVMLCLHPVI